MERKGLVELLGSKNEKEFRMLVPSNASLGETYDVMLEMVAHLVKLMEDAVKKEQDNKEQEKKEDGSEPKSS